MKVKILQLEALVERVRPLQKALPMPAPEKGWIRAVREALGLSMRVLGKRMGISTPTVAQIEKREPYGGVTLATMQRAAQALNCEFVYAIVPREGTYRDLIEDQAMKKAEELLRDVNQTMLLEDQLPYGSEKRLKELARELAENPRPSLWE